MKYGTALCAMALACTAVTGCGGGPDAPRAPVEIQGSSAKANAPAGALTGNANASTVSFLGIPYALAPVGGLRWKSPAPARAWSGSLDATRPAKHCPQENNPTDVNASEDCLFLNVYSPRSVAEADAKRPVMVWIHGGANAFGAGDEYDPTPLVERGDVVVVTLNYRLGALGFLTHPALRAAGGGSGNYGVQDQQLALRWVRANIAAFGGDPGNVTIFGESAGGLNVTTHLVSPASAGLFHKAIIQSGGYLLDTPAVAEADMRAATFAGQLGCDRGDTAACLRARPVAAILAAQGTVNTDTAAYRQMVLDGTVLPESQGAALAAGRIHKVPVLLGSNANEGNLFFGASTDEAGYRFAAQWWSYLHGRDAAQTLAAYPLANYASPGAAAAALEGDSDFACPARRSALWLSAQVPTYAYEFDDPASQLNSGHFADVHYLFDYRQQPGFGIRGPAASQALAASMQRYWTNFARTGDPNGAGLPPWPRYQKEAQELLRLTPPAPQAGTLDFSQRHHCAHWG